MDEEETGERVHPQVPPLFYLICPLPFPEELSTDLDEFAKNGMISRDRLLGSGFERWEVGISCNPAYGGLALRWNHS